MNYISGTKQELWGIKSRSLIEFFMVFTGPELEKNKSRKTKIFKVILAWLRPSFVHITKISDYLLSKIQDWRTEKRTKLSTLRHNTERSTT